MTLSNIQQRGAPGSWPHPFVSAEEANRMILAALL